MAESKSIQDMADEAGFWLDYMTLIVVGHEIKISGVKEELKMLMVAVKTVKDFLKTEAQMLRKKILEELDLERRLKEVTYDVEDAIESSSTKMAAAMAGSKCCQGFMIERHARALETIIKSIKSESLDPTICSIPRYKVLGIQQQRSTKINQVSQEKLNEEPKKFVGLKDDKETLISSSLMKDEEETEEVDVIAIGGMTGIRKTTLTSKIYHNKRIIDEVPTRIWGIDNPQESCSKDSSKTVKKLLPKTGKVLITSRNNDIIEEPMIRKCGGLPLAIGSSSRATCNKYLESMIIAQVPPPAPSKFVGLKGDVETLISSLMEDEEEAEEVGVIAVTGMAGIGKTTLASKIFHDKRICDEFPTRIWLNDLGTKELCHDILKQCMNPTHQEIEIAQESCSKDSPIQILNYFSGMNDYKLKNKVRYNLTKGKYLIVLDDVWDAEPLKTFSKMLPPKTGKVLITSRNNNITTNPHVLRFLNEKESWELLQLEVFRELDVCPETLKSTGERIAQSCAGLPLAIAAAGNSLVVPSSTIDDEFTQSWWKAVSENVKMDVAEQPNVLERLESSYIELPQHMRECFLYLGVFPEDHEIPVRTLTRLWIAEGFVPDKRGTILRKSAGQSLDESGELVEETAAQYLHHLIDRNLVMVGKSYPNGHIKTCRLHILIYAFCKFKAAKKDLYQEIKITGDSEISLKPNCHCLCIYSHLPEFFSRPAEAQHDVRSILCFNKEEDSSKIHECFNLCSLCFNQGEEEYISRICERFKLLRVLHCSHAKLTRFPTRLGKLIHLRHISLSCDKIRVIPEAVSSLRYLETLVVHTESASVQLKANIWSMFHLRHLVTKAAIVLAIRGKDEEGKAASKNLQTLTRLAPKYCTEDMFTQRTPNLKTLGIRGNLADFAGADSLKKLKRLEKLTLINEPAKEIQRNLDCLPLNIKRLTLSGTHLKWESMSTLGKIESLEILKLKNNAFVGGSWSCTKADGFGRLGFLLIGTTDLDSWEASDDCFPNLKRLVLNNYEEQKVPSALAKRVDIEQIRYLNV